MKLDLKIMNSKHLKSIPKELVNHLELRAYENHSQTLDTLNDRGGVSVFELYCLLTNQPFNRKTLKDISEEFATEYIKNLINKLTN